MDRRNFIRRAVLVGSASLLTGPVRGQTRRSDVLVIGAGMAGLITATELDRAGLRVRLLEGQARVGGRMLSVSGPAHHGIELGAQVIHGSRAPTHGLLAELGIEARPVVQLDWVVPDADGVLRLVDDDAAEVGYETFVAAGQAHRGPDISAGQLMAQLDLTAEQRELLLSAPLSYAAEPSEISLFSMLDYDPTWAVWLDTDYQVVGGYRQVAERLAAQLGGALHLNTRVEQISWRRGRVRVTARTPAGRESFAAAAVVVTLPLGVLQAGHVSFAPALPGWKLTALEHLGMGRVVVQQMTFERDFWSERLAGAGGWSLRGGRISFSAPHGPGVEPPALTAWITGDATEALASLPPDGVQSQILAWIEEALPGSDVARRKRWVAHKNWQRDPFTLGAYSFTRPGGHDARERLATPLQGALFFAGEATIGPPYYQTVHGAYLTGLRAAREVAAQL